MKISKQKLKQIIQEEINNLKEKLSAKDKKEKAKLKKQKKLFQESFVLSRLQTRKPF